jgi:hypothetical protein
MRQAYAHEARLEIDPDGDERAPGAAVTVALCGHWDHEPPCRVPHRSDVVAREGDRLVVRVLFACPPADTGGVRAAVAAALAAGELPVPAPDAAPETRWRVLDQEPVALTEGELPVAARLVAHPRADQ